MSSFKKLNKSDVTVVPYAANKQWTFNQSNYSTYSTVYKGTNVTGSFDVIHDPITAGVYERLIYNEVNQLFYQTYTASLNTSSLASSLYYESASQQRPTGSYFMYNDSDILVQSYPSSSNSNIRVLAVNQSVYGNKILPNTFRLTTVDHNILDDGYGNLYDTLFTNSHAGNIYYAHGLIVITDPNYQLVFNDLFTVSFKNEYIVQENEVRCLVKESDYNLSYNPTMVSGSYDSGSLKDFATGSDFHPYATSVGLYNDNNQLLAVAKFGKPILISPHTDMTFVVKYDT
jgi:hypothetical protein